MAYINDSFIQQVTEIIINTRDFCGNERDAAYDYMADFHDLSKDEKARVYSVANYRANAQWNAFKKAVGVNPKYCF